MAFLLSGERPAVAAASSNPFRVVLTWLAEQRAKRARRMSLSELLEFDSALLDDLGIERRDVIDALHHQGVDAGRRLAARRAESSRNWRSYR